MANRPIYWGSFPAIRLDFLCDLFVLSVREGFRLGMWSCGVVSISDSESDASFVSDTSSTNGVASGITFIVGSLSNYLLCTLLITSAFKFSFYIPPCSSGVNQPLCKFGILCCSMLASTKALDRWSCARVSHIWVATASFSSYPPVTVSNLVS